jgi:predicted RNase H-like nuclease (RuvC/YqgF family)
MEGPTQSVTTMEDALKNCEDEVARLKTENRDLRQSSEEFGELAERLNRALREGRVPGIREAEGGRRDDP